MSTVGLPLRFCILYIYGLSIRCTVAGGIPHTDPPYDDSRKTCVYKETHVLHIGTIKGYEIVSARASGYYCILQKFNSNWKGQTLRLGVVYNCCNKMYPTCIMMLHMADARNVCLEPRQAKWIAWDKDTRCLLHPNFFVKVLPSKFDGHRGTYVVLSRLHHIIHIKN